MTRHCEDPSTCARIIKVGRAVDAAFRLMAEVDLDRILRQMKISGDPFLVALAEIKPGATNLVDCHNWEVGLCVSQQGHRGLPNIPPLNVVVAGAEILKPPVNISKFESAEYHWLMVHDYPEVV